MADSEGFLTDGQREMLIIASQNAEVISSLSFSSSPKSSGPMSPGQNSSVLSEHHFVKVPGGGQSAAAGGIAVRHVRRSHSGKFIRVKKGMQVRRSGMRCTETKDLHLQSKSPRSYN